MLTDFLCFVLFTCLTTCSQCCAMLWSVVSDSLSPHGLQPPDSSVHGIFQARIVEWVVISTPRNLPKPGIKPRSLASPALGGQFFTSSTTWEAPCNSTGPSKKDTRMTVIRLFLICCKFDSFLMNEENLN